MCVFRWSCPAWDRREFPDGTFSTPINRGERKKANTVDNINLRRREDAGGDSEEGEREGEERVEETHTSCIQWDAWSGVDLLYGSKDRWL